MKFLVCRTDAIRSYRRGHQIGSSCFPIIVDHHVDPGAVADWESILKKAFDQINEGYVGLHQYLIVPLYGAQIVSLKPKPAYDIHVRPYEGM